MNRLTGKNIYLLGFMATGKSRIGRELAQRLRWPYVDTDQCIEQSTGHSISEIFRLHGEAAFRELESATIRQVAGRSRQVVSLGGGAIMRPENWRVIHESGLTICLTASVDTIVQRVQRKDNRPLLRGRTQEELVKKIQALLDERLPYYQRADFFFESREEVSPYALTDTIYRTISALL
ncbi:shikimate kinase [bacterium]|nr:shikimate kinase [bacterium]